VGISPLAEQPLRFWQSRFGGAQVAPAHRREYGALEHHSGCWRLADRARFP
jgi:hypothetical protein